MPSANAIIRIFFAIDLPATMKTAITETIIHPLQQSPLAQHIRWIPPENLHITLQFLKAVDTHDLVRLISTIQKMLKNTPPFFIELAPPSLFPTPHQPTVIALETRPSSPLADVVNAIQAGMQDAGYPTEPRPFRGHLTLGKIAHDTRHTLSLPSIAPSLFTLPVNEIVLFQSEPTPAGSRYTPLEHLTLVDVGKTNN